MPIRITVEVDTDRLAQAGMAATEADILAELDRIREGRAALQSREGWLPVRDIRVRVS